MRPVIDDNAFSGSDKGLVLPTRRLSDGHYKLSITSHDRSDPPAPYVAGAVPRDDAFNSNVVTLPLAGGMPIIHVQCAIAGFDPATVPLIWRLQSLHVLGRHKKSGKDASNNPRYKSLVVPLGDEWRGESHAASFNLFPPGDPQADHVGGGHAILTVAARPPGASGWLQDFVHLRITGSNPTEREVRAHVAKVTAALDPHLEPMLDAIFAWEAGFKQFASSHQRWTTYSGVRFDWPDDPPGYPVAAFDFGVGLSQFTHPGSMTASIAWDWRDNMNAGINIFLEALRDKYKPGMTWAEWAVIGWTRYNGSASYAQERLKSVDGKLVSTDKIPVGTNIRAITEPLALAQAPKWPVWPVTGLDAAITESVMQSDDVADRAIAEIVAAVTARIRDAETLTWLWPLLEQQLAAFEAHGGQALFPGISEETAAELASLGRSRLENVLRMALLASLKGVTAGGDGLEGVTEANLEAPGPDLNSEWAKLSSFVQQNIQGGFAGFVSFRTRLFSKFGAADDPATAIARINAYYKLLVAAGFPKASFKTPVHPDLKKRLDEAAKWLEAVGASVKLNQIKGIGGFAIRPNVNSPTELSNHSFGWAVDMDAALNPNIKIPDDLRALIQNLTGVDIYGADSVKLRTPAPYADLLPATMTLSKASAAFVDAFKTDSNLAAALGTAFQRLTAAALAPADLNAIVAFGRQQPPNKQSIKTLLASKGVPAAAQTAIVTLCTQAIDLQRRAKPVTKPEISGSDKTIARFGFFNLPPEVVAALVANNGGALRWLGAANGTKDYMHFELYPVDAPKFF